MSRLPSRPLFDAAAYVASKPLHATSCRYCRGDSDSTGGCVKAEELAQLLGVSRKTITRWSRIGIPLQSADQLATRLGYNPIAVWGLWWDDPEYLTLVEN